MEVFILCVWLCVAMAQVIHDFAYSEELKRYIILRKKYRPKYHVSSPLEWLNEPAGFLYHKNQYHLFYQYRPYKGKWDGGMSWGHAVSDDLAHWSVYPPVLISKEMYDRHGCYAGSTITHNGYLTIFYTGESISNNVTHQTQNIAISSDGVVFHKYIYNPVLKEGPYGNVNFRNPKVWQYLDTWYMIIGSTKEMKTGSLLLYSSKDLFHWNQIGCIAHSYGDMGYMWENPDLFQLGGYYVLILTVLGMPNECYRFKNEHQTGYTIGNFDYMREQFYDLEISMATFHELDYGHDFSAVKTMLAPDGRRLLIGWLGMWGGEFQESKQGWAGLMTIVREISLNMEGRLLMKPVKEILKLRAEVLEAAWYQPGEAFHAGTKSFELLVNSTYASHDVSLTFEWSGNRQYIITYYAEHGYIMVDRGGIDGVRKADWFPRTNLFWRIFVDHSSIEIFCGEGEVVFSSRIYPKYSIQVTVGGRTQLHIIQYRIRRGVNFDKYWDNYTNSSHPTHFKRTT